MQTCVEPSCNEPKIQSKPRCREHQRAMQRKYDQMASLRKKGLTARAKLDFSELCRAIESYAIYATGYRNGAGDRAVALAASLRKEVRDDATEATTVQVRRGERLRLEGMTVGVR